MCFDIKINSIVFILIFNFLINMKCVSLLFLLKLLGLEPLFNFDPFPNFRNKKCYTCKVVINWAYPIFILLLLMYQPVLETVLSIQEEISTNIPNTLFYYITPIHYYIAFRYFHSQRKKRIYESRNMDFLDNGKGILKCMPREDTLIKSVSVISLIVIIEAVLTLFLLTDPEIYDKIPEWFHIFSKILITVSIIPGRLVLVINTHVFFFSFLQQLRKLQDLEKKLKVREWKENKKSSVAILCYEIVDIRYTISRLISKTEYMYISTTVLGGISVGLILEFNIWDYQNIASFIIFILMQIIFLTVIYYIGNSRVEINKIIHRRSFASKYILRKNDFCQACLNVEKKFIDLNNSRENIFDSLEKDVANIIENGTGGIEDSGDIEMGLSLKTKLENENENENEKKNEKENEKENFKDINEVDESDFLTDVKEDIKEDKKETNVDDADVSLQTMLAQRRHLSFINRKTKEDDNITVTQIADNKPLKGVYNSVKNSICNTSSPFIVTRNIKHSSQPSPLQFKKRKLDSLSNSNTNFAPSPLHFRKRSIGSNGFAETTGLSGDSFTAQLPDSLEDSAEIRRNINELLNKKGASSYLADSGCYLTTEEYVRCIYEWSTNTGSSVDWLILTNLLSEHWSSFGLFGIKFTDGKALRNSIFVTSTIIASGSVLGGVSAFFGIFS